MKKMQASRGPTDKLPNRRSGPRSMAALAVVLMLLVSAVAAPASTGEIKSRMRERLPVIVELKAAGAIGENNQGFLEYRREERPQEEVVQAENLDRQQVYAAIARQQGVTAEFVGQRRAEQIAANAPAGVWLQDAEGDWYRKE